MFYRRKPSHTHYFRRRFPKWEKNRRSVYTFLASTLTMTSLLLGPFIYLANENFLFFQKMAVASSPTLLTHLEREQFLFNIAAFFLVLTFALSHWWFSSKFVSNFQGQVHSFDRHLKHLIRGEWFTPSLRVREKDDFKDLVEQYGYFYKSLQAMTKAEIQLLEKMKIDPSQRENFTLWKMLLQQKKSRLGHEEIITENTQAAHSSIYWNRAS